MEADWSSPAGIRHDILARYAILWPKSAAVWWCEQHNGHAKAGYRTREIAERAAAEMMLHGEAQGFRPYLCRMDVGRRELGEHWHLASPRRSRPFDGRGKRSLTPTDKGRTVSGVSSDDTSPEERTA
jgi:hypothetical protein